MMFSKSWLVAILVVAFAEEHLAYPSLSLETFENKFINSLNNNREIQTAIKEFIDSRSLNADVNPIADVLFAQLNKFLFNKNMTSFDIAGTEFVILGNGLIVSEGKLNGIDSIVRKGNVMLTYDYPHLSVKFGIGLQNLTFQYKYEIKTWFGGPTGVIIGTTEGNHVAGDVTFDTTNLKCTNAKVKLETLGNVDIKLKDGILEGIVALVINGAVDVLQIFITGFLNGAVEDVVKKTVTSYNDAICNILGNCA